MCVCVCVCVLVSKLPTFSCMCADLRAYMCICMWGGGYVSYVCVVQLSVCVHA